MAQNEFPAATAPKHQSSGGAFLTRPMPGGMVLASAAQGIAGRALVLRLLIAALAGAIATLAQAPFHFLPALLISFTALAWLIDGLGRWERRLTMAGLIGWAFGVGYFASGLYWIGHAFFVNAEAFGAIMPFAMAGLWAGLALFPAAAIVLARLFWTTSTVRVLVLATAWAILEWVRGHVLTGFPWALAGYAWGETLAVLQVTSVIGIYGLSFLTVLLAAAPAALVSFAGGSSPRAAPLGAAAWLAGGIVIFVGLFVAGQMRLAAPAPGLVEGVTLRLVQPSVPQAEKVFRNAADIFARHLALTKSAGLEKASLVIWPEGAVPALVAEEDALLTEIANTLSEGQSLVIGSTRLEAQRAGKPERYFNSLHVINGDGDLIANYDKQHLVPFGEYLPFQELLGAFGLRQIVENASGYTPGPALRTLQLPGLPDVGPLICYEAIFPGDVVDGTKRPGWLLNITDDTWFGDSTGPRQHFVAARVRAIEEGLPLARAANNGISAVISARGEVLARLDLNAVAVLDAPLPQPLPPTLYARLGDTIHLIVIFASICWVFFERRKGLAGEG